jgi:hypothetical protein
MSPDEIINLVNMGIINRSEARTFLGLEDEDKKIRCWEKLFKEHPLIAGIIIAFGIVFVIFSLTYLIMVI